MRRGRTCGSFRHSLRGRVRPGRLRSPWAPTGDRRQGVRVSFMGNGGELIFEELPTPANCTSRGKDGAEAPKPEEEKPWYKDIKVRGFGVQMPLVKGRVLWA